MKKNVVILLLLILVASCTTEQKPRIVYNENGKPEALAQDTSAILMADLPILIDSTDMLVHPIGALQFYESRSKIFGSYSGKGSTSFSVSNYGNYTFSGNLTNLKFEHIGSDKLIALTGKNIRINSARFLHDLYRKTRTKLFFYQIIDSDSNKDGRLDNNDIEAIYFSHIDGSNFRKLTADNHELIDCKTIDAINRMYCKTIEDTNKDGVFDKNDQVHYYYISLVDPSLTPIRYSPI